MLRPRHAFREQMDSRPWFGGTWTPGHKTKHSNTLGALRTNVRGEAAPRARELHLLIGNRRRETVPPMTPDR